MKKIFSSILVLAMLLSICTFNVHAATATGTFDIAYYSDSTGTTPVDLTTLKANDVFYARIMIKNTTTLVSAALNLTWDPTAVKADDQGSGLVAAACNGECLHIQKTVWGAAVYTAPAASISEGLMRYELGTNQKNNAVSGDNLFANVKFVVQATADPKFTATLSQVMEGEMLTPEDVDCNIPAYSNGSNDGKETKYFAATLPACEKATASTGVKFKFDSDDDATADKYYDFSFGSLTFENAASVKVGLEVKDAPSALALTSVDWIAK